MDLTDFRRHGHELIDWMADYLESVRDYPVRAQVAPGDIIGQLPDSPPEQGETFETIFSDFEDIIIPGMTHWQHPSFFAYFPANSSPPSVLAEMLMATLGAQCMIWQTSPAAAELEERVMQWLRSMIGLPGDFVGVIQDTASTATLCAILTARERFTDYSVNSGGLYDKSKFIVYCSTETHSSIEKAVKIAGLGSENLRKIAVNDQFAMKEDLLEGAIQDDLNHGLVPLCVIAAVGTTGSTAVDPLGAIGAICQKHDIWLHVDAAYSGTALLLPEMRWMITGIEAADSFVFNPHKWMFTNFDCSAYFVKDAKALVRTFDIMPEYLKTHETSPVNNYRDWGIPLGRRFRALKLWFVIRSYGVEGLRAMISAHINLAHDLADKLKRADDFEVLAPVPVNLICFRYQPAGVESLDKLNSLNENLLEKLNATGKLYLTHTKLNGAYAIRIVIGQTQVNRKDVQEAWNLISTTARDNS